ncbi:MAG: LysR family transcriptional regulator [Pseudomonadota bacterium]
MSDLPPLAALEALSQLDRRGSLAAAARVLNLTPGAVGHQIRVLEARLGAAMTEPDGRGLRLTQAARAYLDDAGPALDQLRIAARRARGREEGRRLRITAPEGFAASWLCPRLDSFLRDHGPLKLAINAADEADIEVRFVPDGEAQDDHRLIRPDFFPVAPPQITHGLSAAEAVDRLTLLHLSDRQDWSDWARSASLEASVARAEREEREIICGDANLLFAAAAAGQGLALGDVITCDAALRSGALARLDGAAAPSGKAYFVSAPKSEEAAAFSDWLVDQFGRSG